MTRKIPKELTEMSEQWKQLKETIIEIRDNNEFEHKDVTLLCQFLTSYMNVLEEEMGYNSDAQTKKGYWISSAAMQGEIAGQIVKAFNCSECGAISVFRMIDGKIVNGDFCPNCRVKMREVPDDK